MCHAVTCRVCGKTTWTGCGEHAEQVMQNVAEADRCPGHDAPRPSGFLSAWFGR